VEMPGTTAAEDNKRFVDHALDRAEALRKAGAYDEGIRLLNGALEREVDHAAIYFRLGNLYIDQGDLDRAERAYRRVLELDPNHSRAKNNLAVVYKRQGRIHLFVRTYKQAQRMAFRLPGRKGSRRGALGWVQDHGSAMLLGLAALAIIAVVLLLARRS
jgi:tetratricopeptide (TPR) repeat protein